MTLLAVFCGACTAFLGLIALAWGYKHSPSDPGRAEDIEERADAFREECIEPKVEEVEETIVTKVRRMRGEDDEFDKLRAKQKREMAEFDDLEAGRDAQWRIEQLEEELAELRRGIQV